MPAKAFPLSKLGYMALRQISKPIATVVTRRARSSRIFRDYFCIPLAQLFHWTDVKIRMRILHLGKVTTVPKLDEKQAIETGAQMLSEMIIVCVTSSVIIVEYNRQVEKEEAKAVKAEQEKQEMLKKVRELEWTLEAQTREIEQVTRVVRNFHKSLARVQ